MNIIANTISLVEVIIIFYLNVKERFHSHKPVYTYSGALNSHMGFAAAYEPTHTYTATDGLYAYDKREWKKK